MKKQKACLLAAGMVLAAALILTGCPKEADDPKIDTKLVHKWADNGDPEFYLKRDFEIRSDGTFTANLNPVALGAYARAYAGALAGNISEDTAKTVAQGIAKETVEQRKAAQQETSWQVSGNLIQVEGDIYKMGELKARDNDFSFEADPPIPANTVLIAFSDQKVTIELAEDGASFTFSHGGTDELAVRINTFFGGTYTKVTK